MVIKRIDNPKQTSSKQARIGALVDYIAAGRLGEADKAELVFAAGDFYSNSWTAQRREMIAMALESARSHDPVDHWLLSWKEGETPTQEQCHEAVAILKRSLGIRKDNLTMCALHCNTDNYHLHVALNRVDPATLRVVDNGWSIDKAHRAVAEIVNAQGWEHEANALYRVSESGKLQRNRSAREKSLSSKTLDMENATGAKSCERIARERAIPILQSARNWQQAHTELAQIGMRYERKGSGAIVWVGNQPVKASSLGRSFSLSAMESRLRAFQPDNTQRHEQLPAIAPQPLRNSSPLWQKYQAQQSARKLMKADAVSGQRNEHRDERDALAATFRDERLELRQKRWPGQVFNVARSLLAADHARRRAALQEKHRRERNALSTHFGKQMTYEQFLTQAGETRLAQDWRYRNTSTPLGHLSGIGEETAEIRDIRYFSATVQQTREGKLIAIAYRSRYTPEKISFRDRGRRIAVLQIADEATVLAALQLAQQKWGSVRVDGPAEFRLLCAKLAERHGIQISNPGHGTQPKDVAPAGNTYEAHRNDILASMSVKTPAQLDWMIAIRMRVTGHNEQAIARSLQIHSPVYHSQQSRNWQLYAERTARAVCGPRGDRECDRYAPRACAWKAIEGRSAHTVSYVTRKRHESEMSR